MSTRRAKLDLHPIFNRGSAIDAALDEALNDAERRKTAELEIICGKGSGALRRRVLRYLDQSEVRPRYHRVIKDRGNHGRVLVSFRWSRGQ